jgi:hypothetical protein
MSKIGIMIPCVDGKTLHEVFGNTDYSLSNTNQYRVVGWSRFNIDGSLNLNYQTIMIMKSIEIEGKTVELPNIISRRYVVENIEPESILERFLEEHDIHEDSRDQLYYDL